MVASGEGGDGSRVKVGLPMKEQLEGSLQGRIYSYRDCLNVIWVVALY